MTYNVDACAAMGLGNSSQAEVNEEEFATPKKKANIPLSVSLTNFPSPCYFST
jgi:hypothetical protein